MSVIVSDFEMLARAGLLAQSSGSKGTPRFDVTPEGFAYYDELQQRTSEPNREAAPPGRGKLVTEPTAHDFAVAFSFAGPQRPLAERLAKRVQDAGYHVFYDAFYEAELWGKDLYVFFDERYRKRARFCVMLISQEYIDRIWTNKERQSAQARAVLATVAIRGVILALVTRDC